MLQWWTYYIDAFQEVVKNVPSSDEVVMDIKLAKLK